MEVTYSFQNGDIHSVSFCNPESLLREAPLCVVCNSQAATQEALLSVVPLGLQSKVSH